MNLTYLKTHVWYLVVIVVLLLAGRSWITEHDARLLAEQKAALDEQQIKSIQAEAALQVAAIEKEKAAIRTPQQAVPVIQAFDPALRPVAPTTTSEGPQSLEVSVDSVQLAKDLESCRIDRVNLAACQKQSQLQQDEVKVLKKKPGFWKRLGHDLKTAAIGVAVYEGTRIALGGKL